MKMSRSTLGMGVGIIILIITLLIALLTINDHFTGLCVGIMFWAAGYGLLLPNFCFLVPADHAYVMSNSLIRESSARLDTFSGYREIVAQREYQAGFYWRYPWDVLNHDVNMSRKIIINEDVGKLYTLKDKKTVRIEWQIIVTPLPGNILNYIKTSEADITARVKIRVRKFIQGYIGNLNNVDFGKVGQEAFKKEFEKVFGGPTVIDDIDERPLGIWTGTPEIVSIEQPEDVQEGINTEQILAAITDSAKTMVTASNGQMDFDAAMRAATIVFASKHGGKVDFVELAGKLFK